MHYSNQFIYSRERRRFGRQCMFSDRTELMMSVHPSIRLRMKYILRNPCNASTQLSDQKALSVMETENVTFDNRGIYHFEGGWPKEVNINDEEQTLRHRKKIERDDSWGIQVSKLIRSAMNVAEQNNAINIYQDFFSDLPLEEGHDIRMRFESRPMMIFHDFWYPQRYQMSCDWVPSNPRQFMSLHTNVYKDDDETQTLDADIDVGSNNAYFIWDMKNPLTPEIIYDAPEMVTRAMLCPKDDNYLAGGYKSGKIAIWDAHAGHGPGSTCPLEAAHREAMSSMCWVHSKSNTEFYTGALDGSIKYWDYRDLKMPIQELLLEPDPKEVQQRRDAHGVMVLEFEYTIPVRYIMGSDMGHVFVGNRKGMTPQEAVLANYQLFAGPIRTIVRNPFFVKNFLICGDWRARIWAEECKNSPSTMFVKKKNQLICGNWSTARCSVFVTGDEKGELDFWDLLLSHLKPIYTIKFKHSITHIAFRPDGDYITVALSNGDTHVLEVDDAMKNATGKEKALIAAMFEREISRSKLLEARVEEIKLKRRTTQLEEEERKRRELAAEQAEQLDPDNPEQFVQMIETDAEFRQALQDFQEQILAVEKKRTERLFVMERTDFEQYYLDHMQEDPLDENPSNEPTYA